MKKLLSLLAISTFSVSSASSLNSFLNTKENNLNSSFKNFNKTEVISTKQGNDNNMFISHLTGTGLHFNTIVNVIAIAPDGTIYVGAKHLGLYKSTDGINFNEVNGIYNQTITCLAITKNGTVYAGTSTDGVYQSTDGINFKQVNIIHNVTNITMNITFLVIVPNGTVYVGINFFTLYKSTDGINFKQVNGIYPANSTANTLTIAPDGTVWVGTKNWDVKGGLYRSDDDGKNFRKVDSVSGTNINTLTIAPNKTIYVGTQKNGLYQSTDGINFNQVKGISNDTTVNTLTITPNKTIYVGTEKNGLYQSTDGINFNQIHGIPNNANVNTLTIAPNKTIYVGTEKNGLYQSTDGINFNQIHGIPNIITSLAITPNGTVYIGGYVGSCGGLWAVNLLNLLININQPDYFDETRKKYDGVVYNKNQQIEIKNEYLEKAKLDGKPINIPAKDLDLVTGKHTLVLTLKDKYKANAILFGGDNNTGEITYNFWVKSAIDKNQINYSTNINTTDLLTGLVSDLGNTNGYPIIQTRSKAGTGSHNATLKTMFDDQLIDYKNSYYIVGNVNESTNDFTTSGNKEKLNPTTEINDDGIYHLHLVDLVDNSYDAYLELGESNWKLKGTINDQALNDLANKLNATIDLDAPTKKQEAMGWLQNYQSTANNTFNISVKNHGKGFDISISDLQDGYKTFLDHVTYTNPSTKTAINQTKLDQVILNLANQKLQNGLNKLPKDLNVDTDNVINKTTLDNYTSWIRNYQDFIKNNKNQWINDIINVVSRGFATDQQIEKIKNHVNSLKFINYLEKITWTPNVNDGLNTSDDYLKFIKLDKLQTDIINWIKQNIPELIKAYQNAINEAESHLSLHGYRLNEILNNKAKPKTKDEINNFADGKSYHNWLQSQANQKLQDEIIEAENHLNLHGYNLNEILNNNTKPRTKDEINNFANGKSYHNWLQYQADKKFHGWQLQIGLGIGIPLLAIIPVIIGVLISWKTKSKNNLLAKKDDKKEK